VEEIGGKLGRRNLIGLIKEPHPEKAKKLKKVGASARRKSLSFPSDNTP
jgi:hypothetical protein